jgi:glucose/arabinose dehydrogenase
MRRFAAALLAGSLIVTACGSSDTTEDPAEDVAPVEEADVTIQIERPTRPDIPWVETPEHIRSNERCPDDLDVDVINPMEEPAVTLTHVAEVPEASALAFAPDGTAFISTRRGVIYRWVEGSEPETVLDLTGLTPTARDEGLLGLAVANDYLFVGRSDGDGDSVVEAYPLVGGVPIRSQFTELLRADQPSKEHNGGDIVFGPDGHLYLTVGDGGGQGGPFVTGRQEAHAFGSLLRFAISFDPLPALTAPPDNPFIGSAPGSDYTWVWGVRHPYRFSFDSATGDLWISDVGQQCVEEVTMLPGGGAGGEHLGWNAFEGNLAFMDQPLAAHTPPTFTYGHSDGLCAVIGGHVYRGDALPDLTGKYVFGDFCKRALITFDPATGVLQEIERDTVSPVGFVIGPDGLLYVVDIAQGIWRVDPAT